MGMKSTVTEVSIKSYFFSVVGILFCGSVENLLSSLDFLVLGRQNPRYEDVYV